MLRLAAAIVGCAAVVTTMAACSDFGGLPRNIGFLNWTNGPVSVSEADDNGNERKLIDRLEAGKTQLYGVAPADHLCGGSYVARDLSGTVVAKHEATDCQNWLIATGP